MSIVDFEIGERYWWEGVKLWYNDCEYIEAMNIWEKSLSNHVPKIVQEWDTMYGNDEDSNLQNLNVWLAHLDTILLSNPKNHPSWINRISIPTLSNRLWFLSTCLLDANDVRKARQKLRQGIQLFCYFHSLLQSSNQLENDYLETMDNNQNNQSQTFAFGPDCHTAAADSHHRKNSFLVTSLLTELIMTYDEEVQTCTEYSIELNSSKKLLTYTSETLLQHSRTLVSWSIRHQFGPWKDPYQRPGYLYPSLKGLQVPCFPSDENNTKDTHHQSKQLPNNLPAWITDLESQSTIIYQEYKDLVKYWDTWPRVGSGDHRGGAGSHDHRVLSGDWREFVLFGTGCTESGYQDDFNPMPQTRQWIANHLPDAVRLAQEGGGEIIISVLRGPSHIRTHCGSTNIRWTAHLALEIPAEIEEDDNDDNNNNNHHQDTYDCRIRVADQWYTWKAGKVFVFDDSMEHEVILRSHKDPTENVKDHNPKFVNSPHHRAVLLIRFWHPNLVTTDEQSYALVQIRHAKEMDTLRRYNPPLAPMTKDNPSSIFRTKHAYSHVEQRGLELTQCSCCGSTGYSSLRISETMPGPVSTPQFQCRTCGRMLLLET
jgi:hypothetical protein